MSPEEIDREKVKKELELRKAQLDSHTIEINELEVAKQIVELQSKRKDLQIAGSKAKQIVRTLSLDIKIITSYFWSAKNG